MNNLADSSFRVVLEGNMWIIIAIGVGVIVLNTIFTMIYVKNPSFFIDLYKKLTPSFSIKKFVPANTNDDEILVAILTAIDLDQSNMGGLPKYTWKENQEQRLTTNNWEIAGRVTNCSQRTHLSTLRRL